ncbi:hypothetical protein [Streptococcus agalactiae]|uniref:hypothetical protein n=1 Tax=Streptococcus agalactiae TaxID=1311 RepID=UPI000332E0B4|nr:hypothetical protein [Streptococcus agalactiae]CCW39650.1 hypothetical protein MSA_7890 [Streptococcus agalactiae ILRI005]
MDKLTNDAKFLLSSMFVKYNERRKDKISKEKSRNFENIQFIKENIMNEWSEEDVLDTCFELRKHGYISATAASDTLYLISLTTEAIAKLEKQDQAKTLSGRIEYWLEFAKKIKDAIPFA